MDCRGPYNKESRTSKWRERKRLRTLNNCTCEYHEDSDSGCECEFHEPKDPPCLCKFHASSSDHDNSWLYNSCSEAESHEPLSGSVNLVSPGRYDAEESAEWKTNDVSPILDKEQSSELSVTDALDEARAEDISKCVMQSPLIPTKHHSELLSDEDDINSNCSDIKICRLDRFHNEDSYYESDGNSESSDNEHSSSDENSINESDNQELEDENDGDPGDDPGGDDPGGDDPGGDDSNVNEMLDEDNFALEHPSLNRVLQAAEGRTAKEVLAMILTLCVKKHLDYETLVEMCRICNVSNAHQALPNTKKQLWAVLQKKSAGIVKYAYCEKCSTVLGELKNLPQVIQCNNAICDYTCPRRKAKYFITISMQKQLKALLSIPGIQQHLQYKNTRRKLYENAREDVLDGDGYKALENMEEFDLTCQLNTDGFSVSKSSNSQGWAILGRINELPPAMRQRQTLLLALIIADGEPDMTMLFTTLVDELNVLSRNGIEWGENGQLFISRVFPTCFCLDARARAILLNMNLYSGHYSCPFCLHPGVKLARSMKFPLPGTEVVVMRRRVQRAVVIPDTPLRTDAGVRHDMQHANINRKVHGFHGASVLLNLDGFNFGHGFSTDDLHPIYIGVTKFLTNLIIEAAANRDELLALIDGRLLGILTPTLISRKPRSIKKRRKYKGTEWRNWLLYCGVPCMNGLISNANMHLFSVLSKAVFLLSRDSVTDNDIQVAQECLERFVAAFQDVHGPEKMRFNVHVMLHLAAAVRTWGPLHLHSTFPFESWNGRLRDNISSPHGATDQIVDRYLLESLVHKLPYNQELDEEVREELRNISSSYVMDNPLRIGDVYFFGKCAPPRPPAEDEIVVLNNEDIHCEFLTEYYQCRKSRMLIHSTQHYARAHRTSKSNNSVILTVNNQFCVVEKIVVFEQGGNQQCGLFCRLLEVGNSLNGASHIREVQNEDNALCWISFDNVRIFAIKIQIRNNVYVVPMSNMGEID